MSYPFPAPDVFKGQFGEKLDFALAPDLRALADELIDRHADKFSHLPQLQIEYLWKLKGGEKSGKATLGRCQRPSGLLAFYSKADFVVWLAWDHGVTLKMERQQVEATLFHELCHIGVDAETDEPLAVPHDVEMFADEVRTYGLWRSDLQCLRQLGLFERQLVDRSTGELLVPTATDGLTDGALARGEPHAHYHDDNPERRPMVCTDPDCPLPHLPVQVGEREVTHA